MAGLNILEDIDLVHLSLGVCPQENVLWEELTGEEHLRFYGRLKDLGGKALDDEVALRLQQVELHNDGHKAAGAYSGGMQRRLCVAIALMGTPAVIALDEPSTYSMRYQRSWLTVEGQKLTPWPLRLVACLAVVVRVSVSVAACPCRHWIGPCGSANAVECHPVVSEAFGCPADDPQHAGG